MYVAVRFVVIIFEININTWKEEKAINLLGFVRMWLKKYTDFIVLSVYFRTLMKLIQIY